MKRTAIVTGGSRGIGLAIAKQLGLDGYQVVVFATKPLEECMEHLKELEEAGITWHYVSGTIDNREDRKRLVEETLETFGRIDVLVNNADGDQCQGNHVFDTAGGQSDVKTGGDRKKAWNHCECRLLLC